MKEDVKLAKWLNGEMSGEELRAFEASAGFETYRKIKEYSGALSAPDTDINAIYQNVTRNKNKEVKVRTLNPWFTKVAAMLLVALGVSYFFYATHTTNQSATLGEHTEFLLPDNSTVILNADSEATFKTWNWNNNRTIKLDGEAYFKVAKGKKFDVVTNLGTVTVVGTQFNVKAREDRFDVTCFEGKVMVKSNGKEILLTPGQSAIFEGGNNLNVPLEDDVQPGWINYEVNFYNEDLYNVIAEMERQYNVTINLKQGEYSSFTGPLPMNDLDTALDNITTAYNLKLEKAGDKIVLTSE
ncbi:FecR family protein [Flavobacterium litorale]|uniref:FecR domain-containing protein n=1 Tax=Flavobacterium litorale TaxID=2856519 RepID=A0ABX8V9P1_9FLAO|nr:FecR domain-containing protein [Flavobacterium litorale]QYJ67361.1 FecR domain-containing protein [Flavobacterium litorale]